MFPNLRTIRSARVHVSLPLLGLALPLCCCISSVAAAATLCVNPEGMSGCKSTIGAAVAAAAPGDTIQVARGTYKEQVTITKSLSLVGLGGWQPTIDATGLPNGIFVDGMSAAPYAGVANVVISGFIVRNANFEGILVSNASDVTILGNHVVDNNRSLDIATFSCPGIPAFETNEGEDCGEGIHLMATNHSTVVRNEVDYNAGGILITDETGPNYENLISSNKVHDNPYDCGITMASHAPATSVIATARGPYGVSRNVIEHNVSFHNGYQVPGAGAGVGIFAPFPGTTAAQNVVIDNEIFNNGLPGVTMHNHAAAPAPAPPVNMDGNVIVGNHIYRNAADTADTPTSGPTGINIFSKAPVTGTVISQNVIEEEAIGIAFSAPAGRLDAHLNDFDTPGVGVENLGTGVVNATENWWHCPAGPEGDGCRVTVVGPGVVFTPWLSSRFQGDSH